MCRPPSLCSSLQDRAGQLVRLGVRVHSGDVCDGLLLRHLFERHNFTDVVHMAAQAGVRHSLLQPEAYVHSNAECFATLLDTMRAWPVSLIPNA